MIIRNEDEYQEVMKWLNDNFFDNSPKFMEYVIAAEEYEDIHYQIEPEKNPN